MKDKLNLIFVHMQTSNTKEKIKQLVEKVSPKAKIFFIEFNKVQNEIKNNCNRRFHCLICKRFMLRIAEKVAKQEEADFIITGENLGQVASQTLDNLKILEDAVSIPLLQPLIGMNKEEIMAIAREIGTFEISIKNASKCLYLPTNPLTRAKLEKVYYQEEKLDIFKLMDSVNLNSITL